MATELELLTDEKKNWIEAINFLKFIKESDSIAHILREHTEVTRGSATTNNSKKVKKDSESLVSSVQPLQPLQFLHKFANSVTRKNHGILRAIDSYNVRGKFLCIKIPCKGSCYQFYHAIWQCNSNVIVMLSLIDNVINDQYWSLKEDSELICREYKIKTVRVDIEKYHTMTTLQLIREGSAAREIMHFQYTSWPLDNISHTQEHFINFISTVNNVNANINKETTQNLSTSRPIIVQCGNGFEKSKVYCLLDACIAEFRETRAISITKTFKKIIQQSGPSISQPENYVFCYNSMYTVVADELRKRNFTVHNSIKKRVSWNL